jgi:hypothetical protein
VKERVFLLLRAPAEAGGRGDGWAEERAVVRIWMLKGRFVDVGCCWVGIMDREGGRATLRMGMGAVGVCWVVGKMERRFGAGPGCVGADVVVALF